ncbi:MAG TPA: poly-beta-1,6 N-acetyl-D-glucosamine export porin PgaA [Pusillimonas sp.]|jgi:biofilm PGA synthesis protein PgaA|nr:poly-beta-1,6 N-acetyl-D-glucosamine export porin PgaA [Pusillimonas sp.]MBC41846.1 poly-beta-1,6 N-acetyl-D-glucosamine export porin PgaA [Pusillimonas sp.]HBT33787.1 poly-beta-1,6 N-acetyl-D-glucosamine export porin PgaA [Pusillimonas sp.]HCP77615.1 poly-beta-1,6 N-acetyl-D-glucosamine export porin PgaA [Pusillimonas sp.]|tara:strand:- start:133243 stop:135273 length:2031 start_codon:yes stop_codon:yes gene_type:complete
MLRPLLWFVLGALITQSVSAQNTGVSVTEQRENPAQPGVPVLLQAQSAYQQQPADTNALLAYIAALRQARLASIAYVLAQQHQDTIPAGLLRELTVDYAAELTRLSLAPARSESERYLLADRALAIYDTLLEANNELSATEPANHRIYFDRIQALHARKRMQGVVQSYEQLSAENIVIPAYLLNEIGDAYLYLEQPEKAASFYENSLATNANSPRDRSDVVKEQIGRYYALQEQGRWTEAYTLLETTYAQEPPWRRLPGVNQPLPNDSYLEVARTWAVAPLFHNNPGLALERLETLSQNAPRDAGLKIELANTQRAYGHPRAAQLTLKQAEALAPLNPDLLTAQAQTALSLQEWEQAQELVEFTQTHYPELKTTQHLQKDWGTHEKWELLIGAQKTFSSDSPVSGSGEHALETTLYSPPISLNWRALVGAGQSNATFNDEPLRNRWVKGGVQWRAGNTTIEAALINQRYGYGQKTGAYANVEQALSDTWTVGGALSWRGPATPLRALSDNISANAAQAWVRWTPDTYREWMLSVAPARFSDGNRRVELRIYGKEPIKQWPTVRLDGEIEISASANTKEDTSYYNPKADFGALAGVRLTHLLNQRYESRLEHYVQLLAGSYSQKHFGTGPMTAIGYGISWRANRNLEISSSILGIRRPYDGKQEKELRLALNISLRF